MTQRRPSGATPPWGVGEDLALRTYSARLLGADPLLVLHGGGNTSVKTTAPDVFGEATPVLCVKGSGGDLASIEPAGHPAVRLEPLMRLRDLKALSDEAMVNAQRQNLMDTTAPNPSVETLLHAFIDAKFIDHTHAMPVLALANQPDAQDLIEKAYGDRVACVPYVMPGFALAKAAASAFEANPAVEGLVLINHGVFSFGATARESYERMIDLVSLAEDFIAARAPRLAATTVEPAAVHRAADVLPVLRGMLAQAAREGRAKGRAATHWICDLRAGRAEIGRLVENPRLAEWAARGVATPDHVIRTRRTPLVLPRPDGDLGAWRASAETTLDAWIEAYDAYFAAGNASAVPMARSSSILCRVSRP